MEFKDRLKELRIEKGISAPILAEHLGKAESTIRMWEIGKANPDVDTLIKLAEYFNCSTDFLLGIDSNKNKEEFEIRNQTLIDINALINETEHPERVYKSIIWIFLSPHYFTSNKDEHDKTNVKNDVNVLSVNTLFNLMASAASNTVRFLEDNDVTAKTFSLYTRLLNTAVKGSSAAIDIFFDRFIRMAGEHAYQKANNDVDRYIIANMMANYSDKFVTEISKNKLRELLSEFNDLTGNDDTINEIIKRYENKKDKTNGEHTED